MSKQTREDRASIAMGELGSLLRWAVLGYSALLLLAVWAFWPGYLAVPKHELGSWVHFHAATATLWMLVLVCQPWLAARGKVELHRTLGRAAMALAIALLVGFVGLAHSQLAGATAEDFGVQAYFGYVRLVIVGMFVVCLVLGFVHRRDTPVHARYMLCTGLSVIDPIFHRLAARTLDYADHNYQLFTFGIVVVLLIALIVRERGSTAGRHVFPLVLGAYVAGAIPLAFDFYKWGPVWGAWKKCVAWFAGLPIP